MRRWYLTAVCAGLAVVAALLPARMSQICSQTAPDGWFLQGSSDLHRFEEIQPLKAETPVMMLVMDSSGSMQTVTERTSLLAQQLLQQGYAVGLISYADQARFQLGPTQDFDTLNQRIQEIPLGGASNLGGGLLAALDWFKLSDQHGSILLISDGQANSGMVDEREILSVATEAGNRGIPIFTSQENGLLIGLSAESHGSSIARMVYR